MNGGAGYYGSFSFRQETVFMKTRNIMFVRYFFSISLKADMSIRHNSNTNVSLLRKGFKFCFLISPSTYLLETVLKLNLLYLSVFGFARFVYPYFFKKWFYESFFKKLVSFGQMQQIFNSRNLYAS